MNSDLEILPPEVELKMELVKESPDFETIFLERKKLLSRVEDFAPVESVEDTPRMNEAKRLRLDLVKKRTFLDGMRKSMGENARKRVNTINEMFRSWINENEEAEAYLKEQEDFALNYEASRKAELLSERRPLLAQYTDPTPYDLGSMTTSQWEATLAGAKMVWEKEQTRIKEEAEKARQEAAERQRLQAENMRLQEEQRRAQAAADEVLREEREKAQKAQRELQAKADAASAAAQKVLDDERRAAQAKLEAERQQREALEKAERERVAAEETAAKKKKEQETKAKRAPDKEKLADFAEKLGILRENFPQVKSAEAKALLEWLDGNLMGLEDDFRKKIKLL